MPVIDDAAAASSQPAERVIASHQAAGSAAGTGHGDGAAADVMPQSAEGLEGQTPMETPAMALTRLRAEAARMKAAKKLLTKNLRNARRVNARLKTKAKKLSDEELLQIVAMRHGMARVSNPKSTGSNTAAASSSAPPEATAARAAQDGVNGVDAVENADEEVGSGSATDHSLDLQRLASRMEL